MKTCLKCNIAIPRERLEALPDTDYCVNCSPVRKQKVYMVYGHKTAGEALVIPSNREAERIAKRAYKRSR